MYRIKPDKHSFRSESIHKHYVLHPLRSNPPKYNIPLRPLRAFLRGLCVKTKVAEQPHVAEQPYLTTGNFAASHANIPPDSSYTCVNPSALSRSAADALLPPTLQ